MKLLSKLIDNIGEANPQLFRELKGRFTPRNLGITAIVSLMGQVLIYLYSRGNLPNQHTQTHRLCVGSPPPGSDWYGFTSDPPYIPNNFCIKDLLGNYMIIKELWWLDLFIAMSVIGIFVLFVVGTYLLIADLAKEENKGTLNFIRLSPQTAKTIFIGKLLGVPSLVYFSCLLAIPFHIFAGISAYIPLSLILSFYGVVIASCICFYNAALLFGLLSGKYMGFPAFLGSGAVLFFLFCVTVAHFSSSDMVVNNSMDWLMMFSPTIILPYLVHATNIAQDTIGYLDLEDLQELQWYGQYIWQYPFVGIVLNLLNSSLWTYWITQTLKRRFDNPLATILSKKQSYWFTASFVVVNLGFVLQDSDYYSLQEKFTFFQVFNLAFFLLLIAALSPSRQDLQDWARYRHQTNQKSTSLWADLLLGEKSPAPIAIAANSLLVILYITPGILLIAQGQDAISILLGFIVSFSMILIYALVAQIMLFNKRSKASFWAGGAVGFLTITPLVILGVFSLQPQNYPGLWLFSLLPIVAIEYAQLSTFLIAICSQLLVISVLGFRMNKQLQKAGASETKMLLSNFV